jgi:hypothetical protein
MNRILAKARYAVVIPSVASILSASDVIACGVGAGAILTGLAFFAYASRKEETEKVKRG